MVVSGYAKIVNNNIMYLKYFAHCIITLVINILWNSYAPYPQGDVGMASMEVLIIISPLFFCSSLIFYLNTRFFSVPNFQKFSFIVHLLLFELFFLFFDKSIPIINFFDRGLIGFLSRGYTLSSIIAYSVVVMLYSIVRKSKLQP